MAFRGMLLQLWEDEADQTFRMVAPDAELTLPPLPGPGGEVPVTKWSQQKLVVTDAVSKKLLQVARLATVAPQRNEKSILWSVTAPFSPAGARMVGAPPLSSYSISNNVAHPSATTISKATTQSSGSPGDTLAAAMTYPSMIASFNASAGLTSFPSAVSPRPRRVCFCFHFRSDFEYDIFARTVEAFSRVQQYSLVRSSAIMEMEINYEKKKMKTNGHAAPGGPGDEDKPTKKRSGPAATNGKTLTSKKGSLLPTVTPIKRSTKLKKVGVSPPSKMICVLCRMQQKPDGPEYPKHPFVLKDGHDEIVHICKVCLQRVLSQRLQTMGIATPQGSRDKCCGLCAEPTATLKPKSVKACSHAMCTRIYCLPCVHKLIGKAQADKAWRTKNWLCPNCSTVDGDTAASEQVNGSSGLMSKTTTTTAKSKQKKRQRHYSKIEDSIPEEEGLVSAEMASSTSNMTPLDYAATYFKFLIKREHEEFKDDLEESEDACFCCKDGGEVVECDWKGMGNTFARCPKVYHEDCLGYIVPEDQTWVCPRHRCKDCGTIGLFSCRFCVTSYCKDHMPKEIKTLGQATRDINDSTYVVCATCDKLALEAVEEKKLGANDYAELFRRRVRGGEH